MQTLTATYRIVTPMFLGDAHQQATDIRPPSFKGVLRFWWRALNWGRYRQDRPDDAAALCELNKAEAALFGAAANETQQGQSRVLIHIKPENYGIKETHWPQNQTPSGYLGLGLFQMPNHPQREGFMEGKNFTVNLGLDSRLTPEEIEQVGDSLLALGLLGGLGSRSRRGFGSIALMQLNGNSMENKNRDEYARRLKNLLAKYPCPPGKPPYTAFSLDTKIAWFNEGRNARDVHAALGRTYQQYRGQPSKLRGRIKAGFGLPLTGVSLERRASPVFMHIHPLGHSFQAVVSYLPAVFHPAWDKVHEYVVEDFLINREMIKP